ncbi:MAG: hypothetical protein OXC57_11045 [Rhodobacteraceae bacterium]|nr:hypothetical protein [Paracoccaceae bacterium]
MQRKCRRPSGVRRTRWIFLPPFNRNGCNRQDRTVGRNGNIDELPLLWWVWGNGEEFANGRGQWSMTIISILEEY